MYAILETNFSFMIYGPAPRRSCELWIMEQVPTILTVKTSRIEALAYVENMRLAGLDLGIGQKKFDKNNSASTDQLVLSELTNILAEKHRTNEKEQPLTRKERAKPDEFVFRKKSF